MFRNADICKQIVKKAKEKGVKVVMSDHEFGWTPSEAEIIRRLLLQEQLGSDVLKIAVMAHNTGDCTQPDERNLEDTQLLLPQTDAHNGYG